MVFTKLDAFSKKPADLPDEPSPTYTASDIKSYFETPSDELMTTVNNVVDTLNSTTDGDSGADNIGATGFDGTASNIQALLNYLKANKTDLTGDHKGTWQGYTPSKSDPGISSVVDQHTAQLSDIAIDIRNYGFVGDGTNDDAISIQNAINYANTLLQLKVFATDVSAGQISIQLPAKKVYIKSKVNVNNAFIIKGHGTATSIVLNANLDYMFDFNGKDANCQTKNEENQMEGGGLYNLRISGNNRQFTLTSAVRLYHVDHAILDTVYFYAVKGKCIELNSARECNFDNIFTRFCGTTTQGNIEVVQEDSGADTSNLNFGSNWNIVFPYGPALKIVNGNAGSLNFTNIKGLLVHGVFNTIYNNLTTYFGTNADYAISSGANQIDITNGEIRLTGAHMLYAPNLNSYVKLTNSICRISESTLSAHYNNNETHGSGDYWFYISNSSTLYLGSGVVCKMANQTGDTFYIDGTSSIYGSLSDISSSQWLNAKVTNKVVGTDVELHPERTKSVAIRTATGDSIGATAGIGCVYWDIRTPVDTLDKSIIQMGVSSDRTTPLFAIPDNVMFKLPVCVTANVPKINGLMWIDSVDGSVKFYINNVIKTVTLT